MKNIEEIIENYKKTKTDKRRYFKSQKELEASNNLTELIFKYGFKKDQEKLLIIEKYLKSDVNIQARLKAVMLVCDNSYDEIITILNKKTNSENLELQSSIVALIGSHRVTHSYEILLKMIINPYHEVHNPALSSLLIYYKKELTQDQTNHLEIIENLLWIINVDYPEGNSFYIDCRHNAVELLGLIVIINDKNAVELLEVLSRKGFYFKSFRDRWKAVFSGKDDAKEALEKIKKRKPE